MWETATISFFQQKYFNVYPEKLQLYASIVAIASFLGSIVSNFISGLLVDYFGPKSAMTIPIICFIKSLLDIPFCAMTYL